MSAREGVEGGECQGRLWGQGGSDGTPTLCAQVRSHDWATDCENGGLFKRCGSAIQKFVTPEVLNQRYNLGELPVVAKGSMAVAEFQVRGPRAPDPLFIFRASISAARLRADVHLAHRG